ncbi:MAG: DUF433 domain-containing protein [Gemmatimonadetes bacterium]|jgi:uncharacterized protein (DUF433 family)|nr:DUF433 domain-containing protein [Gemmatimonadota bacterium]
MTQARVTSDPAVMVGKPVIEGTRITVELILEELAAGAIPEQILESYPHLPKDSIPAALRFAAEALSASMIYPSPQVAT